MAKRKATGSVGKQTRTSAKSIRYWLFKTEPSDFSIDDLRACKRQTTHWDGVRNYQARNLLRDEIHTGDRVLLYHSSTDPTAIVGVAKVVRAGYPDPTALDPKNPHFDPKATADDPRWFMVDIQLESIFSRPLELGELRQLAELNEMELLRRGSRLSVQPVRPAEFRRIVELAGQA